jgi:hypothetical protein
MEPYERLAIDGLGVLLRPGDAQGRAEYRLIVFPRQLMEGFDAPALGRVNEHGIIGGIFKAFQHIVDRFWLC